MPWVSVTLQSCITITSCCDSIEFVFNSWSILLLGKADILMRMRKGSYALSIILSVHNLENSFSFKPLINKFPSVGNIPCGMCPLCLGTGNVTVRDAKVPCHLPAEDVCFFYCGICSLRICDYDHGLDLSVKVLGEVEMLAPAYSTVTGSQQWGSCSVAILQAYSTAFT